jgi:AcrR family transcriptional regulator
VATSSRRSTYHHGDLANALTDAATELAREGGPEAVVLREAARRVGVSATAAYRHFASHGDLYHAVKSRAQDQLADYMEEDAATAADPIERLRAIGSAYLRFALAEPGLYRTAFSREDTSAPHQAEPADFRSYRMLQTVLDEVMAAGLLDPARRAHCETALWSTVHGLALLLLDGPLAAMPPDLRQQAIDRVLEFSLDGICPARAVNPPPASGRPAPGST